MSDIPDWLVELAAQQSQDDSEEEAESEWDFLRDEPEPELEPELEPLATERLQDQGPPEPTPDMEEGELVETLRSQVDAEDEEPEVQEEAVASGPAFSLRIPGLLPWQQFVLAVLLFLDIAVIGLLFLVMLGRMSIP
ncbi:MAG: hypothetical protein ACP5HS_14095 [Anaerolineae bacterium]